ncbi:MAG: hypothetical protein IPJ81_01850 [Chitinophagaceae bacterium]|nr:hypothetical protein [Chitinophagaceae bacterium]
MAEDRLGRLWIASDEGINIFDGNKLESYSQPDNSGLINNNISQIFCDKAGTIWIKSNAGIQYKKESDTKFQVLLSNYEDINNTIFFGQTAIGEILCITEDEIYTINNTLKVNKLTAFSPLFKKYNYPSAFYCLNGNKWFIAFNNKLVLVDIVAENIIKEYDYTKAWSICKINDSTVMAGSFLKDSVAIIHTKSGQIEYINNYSTDDGLPIEGFIGAIEPIGDNKFALASRLHGVYIIDITNKYATHLLHDPADATTIKSKFCRRLFVSKNGVLFVHSRGISYTSTKPRSIHSHKYLVNTKGEKYDGGFNDFVQDKNGKIWIATNGGLAMWERKTNISTYYPFYDVKEGIQKFKPLRSVALDKFNQIWVGSFGGGLGMLKPDGTYDCYKKDINNIHNSIPSNEIYALVNDNEQKIFICANNGFALLDPIKNSITAFLPIQN